MREVAAFDVAVLGNGIAGFAAAIGLARGGHRVVVIAPMRSGANRAGESLSPAAAGILRELGLWDGFVADGHLPCHANKSIWGSSRLTVYDFINDPRGHAWHIDRERFEDRLAREAAALGVACATLPRPASIERHDKAWRLAFGPGVADVTAPFVVDATGRASWFARRHGAIRLEHDRQVALSAILSPGLLPSRDSTTLIEAVETGWWYSALVPDGRLVTTFMTDPDMIERDRPAENWFDLVAASHHTRNRIAGQHYRLDAQPQIVAANGSRLDRFSGENWLAVGDAAMCFDPLSAHGITVALASGRDAAKAVSAERRGDRSAFAHYGRTLDRAFAAYLARRQQLYAAEGRWPDTTYWRRRRKSVKPWI